MGAKPPLYFTGEAGQNFSQKALLSVGQESVYGQTVPLSVAWGPEYVNHSVVASVWVAVSASAGELAGCGRLIQTASSTWGGLGRCTLVGQCVRQGLCKLYSLGELRRACVEGEEAVVALMAEPAANWISVVQEQQQRIQTPPSAFAMAASVSANTALATLAGSHALRHARPQQATHLLRPQRHPRPAPVHGTPPTTHPAF